MSHASHIEGSQRGDCRIGGPDQHRSSRKRARLFMDPLPELGKVCQKELTRLAFPTHWKEGIHQNIVFVGHGRTSQSSVQKAKEKAATQAAKGAAKGQQRNKVSEQFRKRSCRRNSATRAVLIARERRLRSN